MTPLPALATATAGIAFVLLAAHGSTTKPLEMVPGAVVTQRFGCTSFELEPVQPACPGGHFHSGIDLAAPAGTPVLAPRGGVARVGEGGPCGIHVVIRHGGGIETLYCHLSEAAVADGQRVAAGQRIGSIGASGLTTGPHLHFEVHSDGRPVDPATWLLTAPATTNQFGGR
ncbi:MAG TPA: M23 family metallopeptidase [Candidatus Dormibacteraeota bacterium]